MKMPKTDVLRSAIIVSASTYNQPIWILGIAGLSIFHYFGHNKNRLSQQYLDRATDLIMEMVEEGTLSLSSDGEKIMPLLKW